MAIDFSTYSMGISPDKCIRQNLAFSYRDRFYTYAKCMLKALLLIYPVIRWGLSGSKSEWIGPSNKLWKQG